MTSEGQELDPEDFDLVAFSGSGIIEYFGPGQFDGTKVVSLSFSMLDGSNRMIAFDRRQLPELIANLTRITRDLEKDGLESGA